MIALSVLIGTFILFNDVITSNDFANNVALFVLASTAGLSMLYRFRHVLFN